jgi:hypothetical protein
LSISSTWPPGAPASRRDRSSHVPTQSRTGRAVARTFDGCLGWLLSWLEFEVTQGSLLAYFFNSAGRHAALAVAALHDIGAGRMEQVLTEAAAVVAADPAAWDKGRSDLDALGEWTVT